MPKNKSEVKVLMTLPGQVIVAGVTEGDDETYTLTRPAALVPGENNALMLLPWIPYATEQVEGEMTMSKSFVVSCLTPVDGCVREYENSLTENAMGEDIAEEASVVGTIG
jgi:hypothetical protein